jgi:hypothetical protein
MFSPDDLRMLLDDLKGQADELLAAVGDGQDIPSLVMASSLIAAEKARASLARRRTAVLQSKAGRRQPDRP